MTTPTHPKEGLLRTDRLPHIWCPGCGLGDVLGAYATAIEADPKGRQRHVCVSGIGCTGRSAGYVNVDSYHTTHGRPIPFATGLKLANRNLEVTVISGDGDLSTIGGNHLIHAARRNIDLNVILVNNFNYGMTGGQFGATTPHGARTTTTPYGNYEWPFNLPLLVAAAGAPFVARWTTLHVRQLRRTIEAAFQRDGFTFIEVISPCPPGFGKKNQYADGLDEMNHFLHHSVERPEADLWDLGITMRKEDPIIVGQFRDQTRPDYDHGKRELLASSPRGAR